MKLNDMTVTELRRLRGKVDAELKRRDDVARKEVLKQVKKIAADHGVSLSDVLAEAKPARAARKTTTRKSATKGKRVPVKYRNPADSSQGWTGRGRKPRWVEEWLAGGKSLDDLLVSQ
ncbi:H-NS histone family protein [Nitrogeniibacter mangrovi]|uniref:H-NS histone family protein n=1 Tax=Nitrogeniibacter mangrovi TaxID=2016596 RepID=A0A6C1B7Z2_9RHOO|nr:H-NS histone family protein [Nitrogeniibacter mangrovi]